MIYWFFGYPGVGKDYCAKKLSELKKLTYIHADDFLTDEDKKKLLNKTFTIENRIIKLRRIISYLKKLQKHNRHIAIADSLPDNISRALVLNSFPGNIKLILVTSDPAIHKTRILKRKKHFFTADLLDDYIKKHWQEINVPYIKFENNPSSDWEERLCSLI